MAGVKTAISLDQELFEKVNNLANELHVSRSRVFTLAVRDYLKKQENQSLLARLNKAYGELSTDREDEVSKAMRAKQRKIVGQESW